MTKNIYKYNGHELDISMFSTNIVTWQNCKDVMGKRIYNKFVKWMFGQTVSMYGPYSWDVENFLHGGRSFD